MQSESEPSPSPSVNGQAPKSPFAPLKTPLLLKYENLTKSQAVQSLLLENAGNILHVDCIIRALYGKLGSDAIREEKPRLFDTLSKDTGIGTVGQIAQSSQMLYYPPQADCFRELADKQITQQSKVGSLVGFLLLIPNLQFSKYIAATFTFFPSCWWHGD